MPEAFIYDAIRTPRGKGKKDGSLHEVKPVNLLAGLLSELQRRNDLDTAAVDDVVMGVVSPIGEQGSVLPKVAALKAGWDWRCSGVQLNRFCASGLEAVNMAAMKVASGWEDLVVAGGVESMSRVPIGSDGGAWAQDPETNSATLFVPQGIGADLIATLHGFSRANVDAYALESQRRATAARDAGLFDRSVVPVRDALGQIILERDEFIKPGTTMDGLAALKPAFEQLGAMGFDAVALQRYPQVERIHHVHHAGNSSGIVDGAAALLIGTRSGRQDARLHAARSHRRRSALSGADPTIMLTGPMPAARKALAKAGLTVDADRPVRSERSLCRRADAVHAGDGRAARQGQRERRRHRHGPPAGRHRRHDPGHAGRRAAPQKAALRPGDAVRGRRHGHRHDDRKGLRPTPAPRFVAPPEGRHQRPGEASSAVPLNRHPIPENIRSQNMITQTIRYDLANGIATLTFDEQGSPVNTMCLQWQDDLAAVASQVVQDKAQIRGVVLASAKSTFFAGADLKGVMRTTARRCTAHLCGNRAHQDRRSAPSKRWACRWFRA